jgi:CheY-like chemotaxis protein
MSKARSRVCTGHAQDAMRTQTTFEEFEQHLHQTLIHLYDPTYQPPGALWAVMERGSQTGRGSIQSAVMQAIAQLKPAPDVPASARVRRLYELLSYRYIQELSQEETAHRLGITPRHLRREQQQAVHVLAQRLWECSMGQAVEGKAPVTSEIGSVEDKALAWRSQVRQELALLHRNDPDAVGDVAAVMQEAVKIEQPITSKHGVDLIIESVQPDLVAPLHPSALRQVLIMAIQKLVHPMTSGCILLAAKQIDDQILIAITGEPITASTPVDSEFIRETLTAHGGSLKIERTTQQTRLSMQLPYIHPVQVLVVDDNTDLVYVYHRYTERTLYQLHHVAEGQRAFAAVAEIQPDIIVLDVMLPDVDGWELLTHMHEHPTTCSTPIIVCSVVRNEELALALGAAVYVQKPVGRHEFIRALDLALAQVPINAMIAPPNTATAL